MSFKEIQEVFVLDCVWINGLDYNLGEIYIFNFIDSQFINLHEAIKLGLN